VSVPLEIGYGSVEMTGETVDLSENGVRANFEGFGVPPEPGQSVDLLLSLEDGVVKTKAEVVRIQARGATWLMSIRFLNIDDRDQDRVRRRVFQALREERARQND
jgi:c-di-GMP-binding flagellar brake protein YcgR